MTSNDPPAPAPRRRPLGRGPATPRDGEPLTGAEPGPQAASADEAGPCDTPAAPTGAPDAGAPDDPPAAAPAAPIEGPVGEGPVRGSVSAAVPADPVAARPGVTGPEGASRAEERARGGGQGREVPQGGAQPAVSSGAEDVEGAGDGRFKVRLANFEGPFDLLLQLIAKHKLDVTEVALSKVTDEFMAYIRALGPDWDLDETTEFLVVAATLLDLKAARLLPAAEVEDEADLALLEARDLLFARLLQYRAYKQIADIFSRRLDDEARRFPRTVGLEPHHAELLPDVVISIGPEGFARLAVKAMQPRPKPQVYVDHIHAPLVSVQEQAGIVVARLKELGEASFRALVEDTDDTLTVVARFLALLELYREKAVALDQETALGELTVRWTGGDGDAVPAVTDEFDRPPEPPQEERTP
ncbi:segregation and condensation protein A [Streptomyces sp. NRRL S-1314]|uniref:segregation and condensation protein A n=1 Tax=Streptomyces TaxID=1883 RepID=UPI0004C7C1B4|nr:segregation/condensation protein A [Streptomyces sp. NRRL S-1314]